MFETLDNLIEANDLIVKLYKQDMNIGTEQLELSKSILLPKTVAAFYKFEL